MRTRVQLVSLLTIAALLALSLIATACGQSEQEDNPDALNVVTTATFLADIAQHVAGERCTVTSLAPRTADLHTYQPSAHDLASINDADLFILNGGGLEETLEDTLRNSLPETTFVSASEGLTTRTPQPDEPQHEHEDEAHAEEEHEDGDPHFWLDPTKTVAYVENIRDALAKADPDGAAEYEANAAAYITELEALDTWIAGEVAALPKQDRLLVMNHVSHGYFADRYGFRIVGAVIPSSATSETATAKHVADLMKTIREHDVRAVFVSVHDNPTLANQIAAETGVQVVDDLLDHALTEPEGVAPTYVDMMKYNTTRIVEALKKP